MIDPHLMEKLEEVLSRHGQVRFLTPLPPTRDDPKCMVLATMGSSSAAMAVHHAHGLPMFGYEAVIIPEDWIHQNLPSS